MSKVLSIYNEWAFYEIVLPSLNNTEYSFLLDAVLFHLTRNEVISLGCVNGEWFFRCSGEGLSVETIGAEGADNNAILENSRYSLTTPNQETLTILVENRQNPLNVYAKYILYPDKKVTLGLDSDNIIRYSYSFGQPDKNFVSHHHCAIYFDGTDAVLEDTSSNGTYVNHIRVNGKRVLRFGDSIRVFGLNVIFLGRLLAINSPQGFQTSIQSISSEGIDILAEKEDSQGNSLKAVYFRAPRSVPKVNVETVVIDPPPNPKDTLNVPLFMQIGPAMTMTIPMILGSVTTIIASRMGGASNPALMMTGMVTSVASALIGTVWAVINVRFNKKTVQQQEEKRFQKYGKYLIDKQHYIEKLYNQNTEAIREKYISAERIADYDENCGQLWSRNINHSDVLTYRIGCGDLPFPGKIEVPKSKFTMVEDSLAEKPQMIMDRFSTMHDVPVCVDLKENNLVGVIGESNGWAQVIRNLIAQIVGNNSYTDVKIAFVYDAAQVSDPGGWDFVKWLPHTWSEDKKIRFYATNKNEASEVFFEMGQILRAREENGGDIFRPHFILFLLTPQLMEGELISKYVNGGSSLLGLSTVIAAEQYGSLPNNCEFVIQNDTSFSGIYSTIDENSEKIPVQFDSITVDMLLHFAKRLANIEVEETESGGEVPSSITFFDMYGISRPEDLNAGERWRKAKTTESMKALIGVKNGGSPCYLDIHERYHGPHGLVAGTTGSGKSETLQTFILSLAINYSPDDVGFFIIDYKGGGMANLFNGLPHMIGSISNLSGNQVRRAMVSIKSENKRRQRIFSEYGVNNINSYSRLYKNGDAREPIPHMLIIIDEFAELKREEPDFMQELISVAQVGRSLGVHLILATQKPSGTVDENIWSNSKFKLCLRVQDRQDSMDMLHRPDAAYLTQAGRGYLQVGNDEIFELFQSGYSGAVYDETLGDKKLTVAQMMDSVGRADLVGNHFKIQHQEAVLRSWIGVLIDSVNQAAENNPTGQSAEAVGASGQFLEAVYENIRLHGMDYKRSSYNDVRLTDFIKLWRGGDGRTDNLIRLILDKAKKEGIRLPEMRNKSQLEAVNEYLHKVAQDNGYLHSIQLWLPVLAEKIYLQDLEGYRDYVPSDDMPDRQWTLSAVIGKGDDPEKQNQMSISIDFANNGHHAVCGTISTGKSTFLQTTVYSLINKYSTEELNLYLIDFSAKLLNVFENSYHVGGIMTDSEEDAEKISKFFTMMYRVMEERKALLSGSNYRDYIEHSGNRLPTVIVVIDNFASFREKTDDKYEDVIRRIAKEGIGYGIYLLITAGGFGISEIPSRLADCFRTTICLEMSDIYQYSEVMRVVKVPVCPEANIKGRGLVYYGDKIIEFQTALACEGESIFERNSQIRERIERINSLNKGKPARHIPVIPEKPVWEEYIRHEDYAELLRSKQYLPNGYDAVTAAYSSINLESLLTYAICGTRKSGKTTYMKTLIRAAVDKSSEVAVIEIGSYEFVQIAETTGCRYITDGQGIYDYAKNVLLEEAGRRAKKKTECLSSHMEDWEIFEAMMEYKRHCIFIPNMPGFLKELYNHDSVAYNAAGVYETLVGEKGFHYNFYFFAEINDSDVADILGYRLMQGFKGNGTGIHFGGKYLSQKFFSFANIPYKNQSTPLKPGIGVVPSEDENAPLEQIVVPNYKG